MCELFTFIVIWTMIISEEYLFEKGIDFQDHRYFIYLVI